MTADPYVGRRERLASGAFALAMHVLFFALLVFGVAWQQHRNEAPVVVELWRDLPPPPPPPQPAAEPEPAAKARPKAEPSPPKVEPKPPEKPDIALKEKLEKERRAREQALAEAKRRQELEEKKRREALAEKKRQEELAEKKKKEELARLAALKEQQAKEAEAKRLAAERAAAQQRLIDEYKRRIADKIKRFIVEPPGLQGNPEVVFDVTLLPGGEVLGVRLARASPAPAWDAAVERAILRAQPLPLPEDPALFAAFRELQLKFRPKE